MIGTLFAAARLCGAVVALYGPSGTARDIPRQVTPIRACRAALALELTRGEFKAELVAAVAIRESSMRPALVNATSGACGPMQVIYRPIATHRRRCARIVRDEIAGYRAGVAKLRLHVDGAGSLARGLADYAGRGPKARASALRTLRRADAIRAAMTPAHRRLSGAEDPMSDPNPNPWIMAGAYCTAGGGQ